MYIHIAKRLRTNTFQTNNYFYTHFRLSSKFLFLNTCSNHLYPLNMCNLCYRKFLCTRNRLFLYIDPLFYQKYHHILHILSFFLLLQKNNPQQRFYNLCNMSYHHRLQKYMSYRLVLSFHTRHRNSYMLKNLRLCNRSYHHSSYWLSQYIYNR